MEKEKKRLKIGAVCFILMTGITGFCGMNALAEDLMTVTVKTAQVRETPSFLGKVAGHVSYGDAVTMVEKKDKWVRISGKGAQGWVHESSLTEGKISLKSGADKVDQYASASEVSLAGKGFSKEVEKDYRHKNPQMDFTWVDKMAMLAVSEKEIVQFIREGDLSPEGGAR